VAFYKPWLTVLCGVLATVGVIAANSGCSYFVPIAVAIISIVLCVFLKLSSRVVFLSVILLVVFVYARARCTAPAAGDVSGYLNRTVVLTASVQDDPDNSPASSGGRLCLQIQALKVLFPERKKICGQARLLIIAPAQCSCPHCEPGQVLQIKGQVEPIDGYGQPWLSGLAARYARQGIFCQIHAYSRDIILLGKHTTNQSITELITKRLSLIINEIRQRLTTAHLQFLGTKAGSLLASMILGDQAVSLDSGLLDAFRKIGLSHIVAASGFNLTVVTMITYWILRVLCSDKRLVTLIVGGNVIIYAALAGLSASIVRAAIMCMLVLVAKYFHRRLHGPAALSLGLIINIIIDPSALTEPGGQLSYAATAGIVCGAEIIADILSFGSGNKLIRIFSASLAVVLMAQLAVLPVQLFHFWQTGLLFLPANLLIDPFVTPVTIAGFLASVAGIINLPGLPLGLTICHCLDWLAAIPLQIIIYVTEKLAAFDSAILNTGRPLPGAIVLYYAMLALWLICLQKLRYRLLITALFIMGLLVLFYQPQLKRPVIIILPHSIICINERRQALCCGSTNRQINKILAYYGTTKSNEEFGSLSLVSSSEEKILAQDMNGHGLLLILDKTCRQQLKPNQSMYAISLGKIKTCGEELRSWCRHGEPLSRSQLSSQLKAIDFKMCFPGHAARFYSLEGATSLSSSVL